MKICTKCKINKDDSEFYKSEARCISWCKNCYKSHVKNYRSDNMEKIREKDRMRDVDRLPQKIHIDIKTKNISRMVSNSLDKIMLEISQCELVCANCHRIRTYMRNN